MSRYEQLQEMIAVETDDCIVWPYGRGVNGYGAVWDGKKVVRTHRAALLMVSAPPTPKHDAAHGPCHNRACVNPRHLSWRTRKENSADMYRDGTDQNGESSAQCKVTTAQVAEIRERYKGKNNRWHKVGPTMQELADEYGISERNVGSILHRYHRKIS